MKFKLNFIFSSIIWDMFISIMILILFSFLAGFFLLKKGIILLGLILFLSVITFFVLLINRFNAGKILLKLVRIIKNAKVKYFLEEFLISFKIYLQKSKFILYFYVASIATQFLKIFLMVFVAMAISLDISVGEIYFINPIIAIASSLPISINGLGIREYVGSHLFTYLDSDINIALIPIFITIGSIIIILGNLLGVIFMFGKGKKIVSTKTEKG